MVKFINLKKMGNERNDHRLRANCNSSFSLCFEFLVLGITSVPKEKREDNGGSAHGHKCKPFHLGGGEGDIVCIYSTDSGKMKMSMTVCVRVWSSPGHQLKEHRLKYH